ncbi:hypothetical protein GCM10009789_15330 [Kribbella sancticallisti]|uniref:Uncharacterized protein n=1 Tax=Kribbella sancticallisti TaxID=460087 RepID=A0ABN2CTN2_9ACTN
MPEAVREGLRLRDRRSRKVQPAHPGAEPREGHRVGADVALQVHPAEPGDVAQSRQVELHHLAEVLRILGEPLHPVVGGGGVRRDPFVPTGPVHCAVVVHPATVTQLPGTALGVFYWKAVVQIRAL